MSSALRTRLTIAVSVALGAGLLWLSLRGVGFADVGAALAGANWLWLVPLVGVTVAAHALRAWRWRLLLGAMPGERAAVPFGEAFAALLVGYLVNQAAPRLGELARAGNLAARTEHSFAGAMGTVVAERVLDVITLGLALLSVVALFGDRLSEIGAAFAGGARGVVEALPGGAVALLVGLGVLGLVALAVGAVVLRRGGDRIRTLAASFRDGLVSLVRVRQRLALVGSTLAIWALYAVMSYVPLRMLGLTDAFGLGAVDAWALMNLGAVGMSLPAPGGTGSYHYVIVQTLTVLFSVAAGAAATYALFTHAAQLVLMCVLGAAALVWQGTPLRAATQTAREASA